MGYNIIDETQPLGVSSLVAIIYGEPGIGKTSLAFTAEKPFLEDYDDGVKRAVGRKSFLQVDSWEDAIKFHNSGHLEKEGIKTLVIDTVGSVLDNYMAQYVIKENPKNARGGGQLTLQGYGALKAIFSPFVDWCKSKKIDVIFIAHQQSKSEGDTSRYQPKMTGGSYDILMAYADLVGYMKSINNKRTINFSPTDEHFGKNTAEFPVLEIPHYTDPEFNGYMAKLIAETKEKMASLSERQQEALNLTVKWEKFISDTPTLEELYPCITEVNKLEPEMVKMSVTKMFKDHALELWDLNIELYEKIEDVNLCLNSIVEVPDNCTFIRTPIFNLLKKRATVLNFKYVGGKVKQFVDENEKAAPEQEEKPKQEPETKPEPKETPKQTPEPTTKRTAPKGQQRMQV